MNKGIVLSFISGIAKLKDLNNSNEILAELKGNLLKDKTSVFPGDYVEYYSSNEVNIINNIIPRKNYLNRPKISNIDYLIIIQSFKEPNMTIRMINKYILYFQSKKIDNIILFFTKYDLLDEKEKLEANKTMDHFKKDGFIIFFSEELNSFLNFLKNLEKKIICFTGQSGVGKSTLLNKINNEFNIKTNIISKSLNRGKHTTTSTYLYESNKGFLVDTPGFSSINLELDKNEIAIGYTDFREYSLKCKFNNCLHESETNCEIKNKINEGKISKKRYEDYLFFLKTNKVIKKY